MRQLLLTAVLTIFSVTAWAEEPEAETDAVEAASQSEDGEESAAQDEQNGNGVDSPKTMSGMSILGNEEAPKSLVIIPWKSSRLGDEIDLSDTLDDRAKPVDKDVFMRQLRFHKIRSGEQT